jgi:hypothetical protein
VTKAISDEAASIIKIIVMNHYYSHARAIV